MKTLLKNGIVVNVFTDMLERVNVLIEDGIIRGVGDYSDDEADVVEDVSGKYICPGFIDGHIHIESTMMMPSELAKVSLLHGTTSIVADPHEIANVCGTDGIQFMLDASENLPYHIYAMLPSCVPATPLDESGAVLYAKDLAGFYECDRVLGLAEMMNYPGVIAEDEDILKKIADARNASRVVDGHAPLLAGKALDKYISVGVQSDHECSGFEEATERIRKGQWIMVREGTAAKNIEGLIDLFDEPWNHRCLLVTDDKNPKDLLEEGHIDHSIRLAVSKGKSALVGIRMATIQAANCFGLKYVGAIAPGYRADILVLDDLDSICVKDVYSDGVKIVENKQLLEYNWPVIDKEKYPEVFNSFHIGNITASDFHIKEKGDKCRVIKTVKNQLLTDEAIENINWDINNGVDIDRDILKLAVIERHNNTGHIGLGFVSGINLKVGAIASSVSHDSHNLIVIGTNEDDMAAVANEVVRMGGGCAAVRGGKTLAKVELPVAGLISMESAEELARKNTELKQAVCSLGVLEEATPFMTMAFISLTVIPNLKINTRGLVDVNRQEMVELYAD